MITEEEKEEIVALAVERTLLMIPEVVGNLMANHAALHKINSQFYKDYPEFASRKDIVQAVVEMVEGKHPLMKYEEMLKEAIPEIRRRLVIVQDVNVDSVGKKLPQDFTDVDISNNGCV
jgi:hypothetical protein